MKNKFAFTDFYLSVTLLTLGEELKNVKKINNSNRAEFIFNPSPTIEKNIAGYRNGTILVEPQNLFIHYKILKGRLYNQN